MKVPVSLRIDKLVSRDATRPAIANAYLRIVDGPDGPVGYLEGTDSYKLARIPVELDEGDTEGFVPVAALVAARKAKVDRIACNGAVSFATGDGTGMTFERVTGYQFPNVDSLLELEPARIDGERWQIGLNPLLLLELAMAIGAETVTLEFTATRPAPGPDGGPVRFEPSNLRPMTVRPLGLVRKGDASLESVGLLMPVRAGNPVDVAGLSRAAR